MGKIQVQIQKVADITSIHKKGKKKIRKKTMGQLAFYLFHQIYLTCLCLFILFKCFFKVFFVSTNNVAFVQTITPTNVC